MEVGFGIRDGCVQDPAKKSFLLLALKEQEPRAVKPSDYQKKCPLLLNDKNDMTVPMLFAFESKSICF